MCPVLSSPPLTWHQLIVPMVFCQCHRWLPCTLLAHSCCVIDGHGVGHGGPGTRSAFGFDDAVQVRDSRGRCCAPSDSSELSIVIVVRCRCGRLFGLVNNSVGIIHFPRSGFGWSDVGSLGGFTKAEHRKILRVAGKTMKITGLQQTLFVYVKNCI